MCSAAWVTASRSISGSFKVWFLNSSLLCVQKPLILSMAFMTSCHLSDLVGSHTPQFETHDRLQSFFKLFKYRGCWLVTIFFFSFLSGNTCFLFLQYIHMAQNVSVTKRYKVAILPPSHQFLLGGNHSSPGSGVHLDGGLLAVIPPAYCRELTQGVAFPEPCFSLLSSL